MEQRRVQSLAGGRQPLRAQFQSLARRSLKVGIEAADEGAADVGIHHIAQRRRLKALTGIGVQVEGISRVPGEADHRRQLAVGDGT